MIIHVFQYFVYPFMIKIEKVISYFISFSYLDFEIGFIS